MNPINAIDTMPFTASAHATGKPAHLSPSQTEAWEAAQKLEAIFLGFMLEEVTKKMPGLTAESSITGGNVYQGMMKDVLADTMSQGGGMGLTPFIYQSLARNEVPATEAAEQSDNNKETP